MEEEKDKTDVGPELKGNTLRVYWFILQKNGAVGVREVQRSLNMSSPSVASHHLSKLVNLDLIEKLVDNSYELKRIVKVGVLQNFIAYRGVLLPRYAFVAMFFTCYTLTYCALTLIFPIGLFDRFIAVAVGIVGALFGWFESYRLWKLKFT